jgi:hypothetical protein
LDDLWVIQETREESKKFLELNENENTNYKDCKDHCKREVIAMSVYIKKNQRSFR